MAKSVTGVEDPQLRKEFWIASEQWYRSRVPLEPGHLEEIHLGINHEEGGTEGELEIAWRDAGGPTPCIICYADAFWVLQAYPEIIELLERLNTRDGFRVSHPDPKQVADGLRDLGWVDGTKRVDPDKPQDLPKCRHCKGSGHAP
jgi:hypothetical protein